MERQFLCTEGPALDSALEDPPARPQFEARRAAIMDLVRHAVIMGQPVHPSAWHGPGAFPSDRESIKARAIVHKHLANYATDRYHPWTGGFWHGLRLAGAIQGRRGDWWVAKRPWLLEDLQRLPIAGQVSGRRLIACPGANLGVEDPLGPDVLAGVLAGARRDMDRGHEWLIVPRSDELQALLEAWCIADHGMTPRGQRRVSPFYGALLAAEMPLTTAASILGIHRAGGCPLLAWCYWEVAYGGQNYPYPPRAWALPWAGGPATLKRAHWGRWSLHREAARLGIAHVPRCLKKRLNHW